MKFPGTSKRQDNSRQRVRDDLRYVDPRGGNGQEHFQFQHRQQQQQQNNRQRRQSHQLANEYEYVPREHGFDYMPPSRYVPSRSYTDDDDTDELTTDPEVKIEVPGSDLSESVEVDYEDVRAKLRPTPVVQGKPIKVKPYSDRNVQHRKATSSRPKNAYDEQQTKHRLQMKLVADEFMRKSNKSPRYPLSPLGRRDNPKDYDRRRGDGYDKRYRAGQPNLAVDVATAYSFTSEDSRGIQSPKEARYAIGPEARDEEVYRNRGLPAKSPISPPHVPYRYGWTRSPKDVIVQDFSKPTNKKSPVAEKIARREAACKPREYRSERYDRRPRRSFSRELREPPPVDVYAGPSFDVEPHRSGRSGRPRDRDEVRDIDPYLEPAYYENPREEPDYYHPMEARRKNEESKKAKGGVLGRIMKTVLGDKPKKDAVDTPHWHNPADYDGDMPRYWQGSGSFETDTPTYPPHRHNTGTGGVPYAFEHDEYYSHRPTRHMRRSLSPRQPPFTKRAPQRRVDRTHTDPSRRRQQVGYAYDDVPERQGRPSTKAFSSAYSAPEGHTRLDHRDRGAAQHRHYQSQDLRGGMRVSSKERYSPSDLQFDGTQVRATQRVHAKRNIMGFS